MENDSNKFSLSRFSHGERKVFDEVYPPEKINAFLAEIQSGNNGGMVDVISTLKHFDFPIREGTEDLILNEFSQSRFAELIQMNDSNMPGTKTSVVSLLRASLEVFWKISDLWPEQTTGILARLREHSFNPKE